MRLKSLVFGWAALAAIVAGTLLLQGRNTSLSRIRTRSENPVVGVETLMKAPNRYRGPIQVEGVVSAVSPERHTLALIDRKEFDECGETTCAPLTLPVQWPGPMPAVRDMVLLQGEIRSVDGKRIFVASALKKQPSGSSQEERR